MSPNLLTDIQNFPTTRYCGSKRKLLPWLIFYTFKNVEFNSVLDGFVCTYS